MFRLNKIILLLVFICGGFGFVNYNLKALPDDVSLVNTSLSLQEKVYILNKLCSIAHAKLKLSGMSSSDLLHLTCRYLRFNEKHEYVWNISSDPLAFDYQLDGILELFSHCKDLSGDRLIEAFCNRFHMQGKMVHKVFYSSNKSSHFENKIEIPVITVPEHYMLKVLLEGDFFQIITVPEHYMLAVLLEGDFFERLTSSIHSRHANYKAFDDLLLELKDFFNENALNNRVAKMRTGFEKIFHSGKGE